MTRDEEMMVRTAGEQEGGEKWGGEKGRWVLLWVRMLRG